MKFGLHGSCVCVLGVGWGEGSSDIVLKQAVAPLPHPWYPKDNSNCLNLLQAVLVTVLYCTLFNKMITDLDNLLTIVTFIERFVHFLHLGLCLKNLCPYFQ